LDSCENQTEEVRYISSFSLADLNNSPSEFSLALSSVERTVKVVNNPSNLLDASVLLNNSHPSLNGPRAVYTLPQPLIKGYFSAKLRPESGRSVLKLLTSVISSYSAIELLFDSDLRIKYKSILNTFLNFEVPFIYEYGKWYDIFINIDISSNVFSVTINGELVDNKVPKVYSGPIEGFSLETLETGSSTYCDDFLIIEVLDANVCTGIGQQGYITGEPLSFDRLDILEGINDTLVVNIDNYGDAVFKLPQTLALSLDDLRTLLQTNISSIDLGGYVNAEVILKDGTFTIKSGTYGSTSSVVLQPTQLSNQLGFSNYVAEVGRPHAAGFNFNNSFREKAYLLENLKKEKTSEDKNAYFIQSPQVPSVEIGSPSAETLSRRVEIDGSGKTFVDFLNRATSEGFIDEVYFHGVLPNSIGVKLEGSDGFAHTNIFSLTNSDITSVNIVKGDLLIINTSGYVSNGTYVIDRVVGNDIFLDDSVNLFFASNLEYSISNTAKLKHFRPNISGNLTLLNEQIIGVQENGVLYTTSPDTYRLEVNWYLNKGDMIGIYNPSTLYGGANDIYLLEATYLEVQGEVTDTINSLNIPKGNNIFGIGLYGRSSKIQNVAVIDLELPVESAIENIEIKGRHRSENRTYNLLTSAGNGLNVSASVSGTHKHRVENTSTGDILTLTHNNVGYNLNAIYDGNKYASNGVVGSFEQNSNSSTYFYISGDGEWVDTEEFASNILHIELSEFEDDPYSLNFNWNSPVTISKVKIYFKEFPHSEGYYFEYLDSNLLNGDGSSNLFHIIGLGDKIEYTKVSLDKTTLLKENLNTNEALYRHFFKTYDGFLNNQDLDAVIAYEFYRRFPYNVLEKEFTPVETTAFNFGCIAHKSTKISEIELFAETLVDINLEDVLELFVAGEDQLFFKAPYEVLEDNTVSFLIHKPIKYIRLRTFPSSTLELSSIYASPLDDLILYKNDNLCVDVLDIEPIISGFSETYEVDIVNNTCNTSDLEINIGKDLRTDSILLKTSANTLNDILVPEIGPPGILYKDSDKSLYVSDNVAINAKTFGLINLAANKKIYKAYEYLTESDSFIYNFIDGSKWTVLGTNYPQLGIKRTAPGFKLEPDPGPTGSPTNPIFAILRSNWHITGSFNARIIANYNVGSDSGSIGSFVGITDSTGRMIYIISDRAYWSAASITRNWHHYRIIDSLSGEIDNELMFCLSGPTYCPNGITKDGISSNLTDYTLNLERIFNPLSGVDVLRFSYADAVNGAKQGELEWAGNEFYEIDLNSLSLIGQLKIVVGNVWSKDGTASSTATNVNIKHFFFGGSSSYETSRVINFQPSFNLTGNNGETNITNSSVYPTQQTTVAAIDLENTTSLDILNIYSNTNKLLWDKNRVQFSDSDTPDVSQVTWGNTTINKVRWVLFEETPTTTTGIKYLEALRIYPDISLPYKNPLIWKDLGNILSDNNLNTYITQTEYPIISIRLAESFSIGDYKLVDKNNVEFKKGSNAFTGWGGSSEYILVNSWQEDPNLIEWGQWSDYNKDSKVISTAKWFAFKNENFTVSGGIINSPKYEASQFIASTLDLRSDGFYTYTDRVDFTEFPEWFNVSGAPELIDIAIIKDIDRNYNGILYSTTSGADSVLQEISSPLAVFDGEENTYTTMSGSTGFLWRVFGTPSGIVSSGSQTFENENGVPYDLITTSSTTTINYDPVSIIGFQFQVEGSSESLPNTIKFQTLTGQDPNSNTSWLDFFTETDLVTSGGTDNEFFFNNSLPYIHYFTEPIVVSGARLLITESQSQDPDNSSITLNNFKIFKAPDEAIPKLTLSSDYANRVGGRRSLKLTYPTLNSGIASCYGTFPISNDPLWSFQDYLSFYIRADSDLMDWSNSYIKLGKNSEEFYKWSLSSVSGINTNSFELVKLKFRLADEQSFGDLNLSTPSVIDLETTTDFKTGPIEYFEIALKPVSTTPAPINVWIDNFNIVREDFNIQSKFNKTLYLNNSELLFFPITNVNLNQGYFEAIVTPDWNKLGRTTYKQEEAFTIFTIANNLNESLNLFYHSRFGFKFVFTNNADLKYNYNIGYINKIKPFTPFKLAVSWSADGNINDIKNSANVIFYIDDEFIMDFNQPWFSENSKNSNLIIGGISPLSSVSFSSSDFYNGITATYLSAEVKSLTGGIENILYSSIPKKIDFNKIRHIRDNVLLSIDNVTFYNIDDLNIPFKFYGIEQGEKVTVYIKINFPINRENLLRELFLTTRWTLK
jgi:hypothetical protein